MSDGAGEDAYAAAAVVEEKNECGGGELLLERVGTAGRASGVVSDAHSFWALVPRIENPSRTRLRTARGTRNGYQKSGVTGQEQLAWLT
jgi:hypothetical protein